MPQSTDRFFEGHARVVRVILSIRLGVDEGFFLVIAPELVKRGVDEHISIEGIRDNKVERGVSRSDHSDKTVHEGRAIKVR